MKQRRKYSALIQHSMPGIRERPRKREPDPCPAGNRYATELVADLGPSSEMAQHAQLRIDTGLAIYFCDPRSPWQRGSNENSNGLLRQYFPTCMGCSDGVVGSAARSVS
jgi:hypothetical protein